VRRMLKIVGIAAMTALGLGVFSSSGVHAQSACGNDRVALLEFSQPERLRSAWLPVVERLYAAIPNLSPKEEEWLAGEKRSSPERAMRAIESREHAIAEVRLNIGSLVGNLKNAAQNQSSAKQASAWLLFGYALIDYDASVHLARLVNDGIIGRSLIPYQWSWLNSGQALKADMMSAMRANLARHVMICTLPTVLGINIYER
jgi:hypothetical protein